VLERCVVTGTQCTYFKNAGVQSIGISCVVEMGIGVVETVAYVSDLGYSIIKISPARFLISLFLCHRFSSLFGCFASAELEIPRCGCGMMTAGQLFAFIRFHIPQRRFRGHGILSPKRAKINRNAGESLTSVFLYYLLFWLI
jgi:hypothetical protein